jgi:gluconokinase
MAILVMGVSGSGKSTLGTALAQAIGCPFLEGDDFHAPESVAKMSAGIPLTDADRWPWLDRLGRAVGAQLAAQGIVVAACSALRRAYRDRLRKVIAAPVAFVLLEADPGELLRRLSHRPHHYMPPSLLSSQLDTLERPQPDEPAITVDARLPTEVAREQILRWLLNARQK